MQEFTDLMRICAGVLGVVCCITANAACDGCLRRVLSIKCFVGVGKMLYSIYLWHWPIFTIFRWTVGLDSFQCLASSFLLMGALAFLMFQVIEKPIRQWPLPTRTVFVALAVGLVTCPGILRSLILSELTLVPPKCPVAKNAFSNHSSSLAWYGQQPDPCACVLNRPVLHTPPSAVPFANDLGDIPDCFLEEHRRRHYYEDHRRRHYYEELNADKSFDAISERLNAQVPKPTIIVIGDSKAQNAWFSFLVNEAIQARYDVELMRRDCVGFMEDITRGRSSKVRPYSQKADCYNFDDADSFRESVFERMQRVQKGDRKSVV